MVERTRLPPPIPFDAKAAAKHVVPGSQLESYIQAFNKEKEKFREMVNDKSYFNKSFNIPNFETFNRDAFAVLLNVPGMQGIRCYHGKKSNGQVSLIFFPVDKDGKIIKTKLLDGFYTSSINSPDGWFGIDASVPCPDYCP